MGVWGPRGLDTTRLFYIAPFSGEGWARVLVSIYGAMPRGERMSARLALNVRVGIV